MPNPTPPADAPNLNRPTQGSGGGAEAWADFAMQYGPRCRDCADEDGVCPATGVPCGGKRKAVEYIVGAIRYGIAAGFIANPENPRISTLFDAIAHGDDGHRDWLREAIDCHFAGRLVPAPRSLSTPSNTQGALEAAAVEQAGGWIIGDDSGERWRTWETGMPEWTNDPEKATRYARREDAEAVHRHDEDAWAVRELEDIRAALKSGEAGL